MTQQVQSMQLADTFLQYIYMEREANRQIV